MKILFIILLAIIVFVGWKYIQLAKNVVKQNKSKQLYIKENLKQFGIIDKSTNILDNQNIFVVKPLDIGII